MSILSFQNILPRLKSIIESTGFSSAAWGLLGIAASLLAASCASMGTPSGGRRDEEPPRFVKGNPAPGSLNVNQPKITIDFNEIVNVKDAFSKVVVSPPSKSVPRVSSSGKRVTVEFQDTLLPNTTYTIDFADCIEDNNEGNKLRGFTYTFSTGAEIDTLRISGMVLSALEAEPQQGMVVAAYTNLADSAFSTLMPTRVAKTDDRGRFTIRGLAPGSYRIYAVNDVDNDMHHANPEEDMAFYDVIVSPYSEPTTVTDTIWDLKNARIDTVVERQAVKYLPNDILLRSYPTNIRPQYLAKYERMDSTRISMIFNAPMETAPPVKLIDYPDLEDWYVLEKSAQNDTLTFWLRDNVISIDTLRVATTFPRQDKDRNIVMATDTLRLTTLRLPGAKANPKKEKKLKKEEIEAARADSLRRLLMPINFGSNTQEVYAPLTMNFDVPVSKLDTTAFRMEMKVDTLWIPAPGTLSINRADTLSPRKYIINYPWEYDTDYRLQVDTLAATGMDGRVTAPKTHNIKVKSESDYCSLTLTLSDWDSTTPAFVELLNTTDKPVRRVVVEDSKAFFPFLAPGKYYARIIEDDNGNGIFDTGNLDKNLQPEVAYYYPKIINIKKNWDKVEPWEVWGSAIDLMKPERLKKNRPDSGKRNSGNTQPDDEEEDDDYFDPTRNPFDPNDRGRNPRR